jgi:hypothetical protein
MVRATSRNNLRTASEVNRGSGSGPGLAGALPEPVALPSSFFDSSPSSASAIASSSFSSCSCSEPTLLTVGRSERVEVGLHPHDFRAACAESGFELRYARAETVQIAVFGLLLSNEGGHVLKIISDARRSPAFADGRCDGYHLRPTLLTPP